MSYMKFIGWTESIAHYTEDENEKAFPFINSMNEKLERVDYHLGQINKNINQLIQEEKNRMNRNIEDELKEDSDNKLESLRCAVKANSIAAIQNIHFLGDLLGKALNASLGLGYQPGNRFF